MSAALKLDLVVLDELGFIPFTPAGAQLIFTFCASLGVRVDARAEVAVAKLPAAAY